MRAARYHEGGDPSVVRVEEIDRPEPGPGELLVAVRAASINPTDAKRRERGIGRLPKTTGSDFAGVVEAVGGGVEGFAAGDRVCGTGLHTTRFQQGSFADYVAVPTELVAPLPDEVSVEQGAAIALVGVTAWRALIDHAGLRPADACLVHGGSGGVGHAAVQLASSLGAHVVATAGSPAARTAVEGFGAAAAVDYDHDDLLSAVLAHAGDGFDAVLDHRPDLYFSFDFEVAAVGGHVVHISGLDARVTNLSVAMRKELTVHPMTMSNLVTKDGFPSIASVLGPVLDLVAAGAFTPEVARTYDLDEAAEVHRAILEDSFVGKLVVRP